MKKLLKSQRGAIDVVVVIICTLIGYGVISVIDYGKEKAIPKKQQIELIKDIPVCRIDNGSVTR